MNPYYQDDWVTLFHGDCLTVTEWLTADVLITDPPYGRNWRQGELKGHHSDNLNSGIVNDLTTQQRDAALNLWGDKLAIVFGDLMLPPPTATKLVAIYQKPADAGLRGAIGGIRRDVEAIYLLGKWQSGIGGRTSVFTTRAANIGNPVGIIARSGGHPHAKSLGVMEELLMLSPPGTVADPFAGSGSTLVAAKALGRHAIGVEIDERYCEIAANRLAQDALDFSEPA